MAAAVATTDSEVVLSGHLRKLKTMKKKFFVLRGDTYEDSARLEYYESMKKYKAGAVPRRALPLRSCFNITRRLDLKQKHVIALFTKEEQFCVVAESEADLHKWLNALLRLHCADDHSDQITHPIQHVWQVNVQKKGLGASKNIQGLYNLCLTDKTLTLVKIKSLNNVISELGIPERVEYALKNIRRCGDSECFFYMEVGRQTVTGAGELWMLSDDSNIAQSMHSTIYHAMRNCAKESENERDHIILPGKGTMDLSQPPPARRQTYSATPTSKGLLNERGLCVCIKQCVCHSGTTSIDDSAQSVYPPLPLAVDHNHDSHDVETNPPNNTLTSDRPRLITEHHRTVSLPSGCALFQEPLKIVHERTRSAPLTGDEVDRVITEKAVMHSSCKTVNGSDIFTPAKKTPWSRRASTGTRFSKLSPAHSKNSTTLRHRCDSVPARTATASVSELERRTPVATVEGVNSSRDETDSEWLRTPRIPEEPDWCEPSLPRAIPPADGYLPMAPGHEPAGLRSASSGSVCSGTPSTHPRFSEYPLEPATAHIGGLDELGGVRSGRAYSVGSRPPRAAPPAPPPPRHRAYSAGAAHRHPPDLMELDFTRQSPLAARGERTERTERGERAPDVDEYVDMSPRTAPLLAAARPPPSGYVEMSYSKPRLPTTLPDATDRTDRADRTDRSDRTTPHGSQTIFPFSPEDETPHPLTTVSEMSEDNYAGTAPSAPSAAGSAGSATGSTGAALSSSPASYVRLAAPPSPPLACNPTANRVMRRPDHADTREGVVTATVVVAGVPPLHYAALDLEPRRVSAAPPPRQYTRIDFARSEHLHADHS